MLGGIDGFGVALILIGAGSAFPDVFIRDVVGMLCRYFHVSVGEVVGAFLGPAIEIRTVLLLLSSKSG